MPDARKRDIVADQLRAEILSGKYGPEGGLPESQEIAAAMKVARGTVYLAFLRLEQEGLIVQRGHSYYVNRVSTSMMSYLPAPSVRYGGKQNYVKNTVPARRVNKLPESLAALAGISADTSAVWTVRISGSIEDKKERPVQVISRYYVFPLSDEQVKRMQDDPTYEPAWNEPSFPKEMTAQDKVCGSLTTKEQAEQLTVPYPSPVTTVQEVMRGVPGDNVVLVQEAILSPQTSIEYRYRYNNQQSS